MRPGFLRPGSVSPGAVRRGRGSVRGVRGSVRGVGGLVRRVGGPVVTVAAWTVAARIAGLARTAVFAGAVGATDLGDVYQSANTVPNVIFELLAGGTLATVVVALLAPAGVDVVRRASAVLTWVVVALTGVALVVGVAAPAILAAVAGPLPPATAATGVLLLRIFAVQLPLYGAGMVLTGVLHAHGRYAAPALAPLLSSLVMIGVYLGFGAVAGAGAGVGAVPRGAVLLLGIGTTAGVAVLTLSLLVPVARLGLRLRPALRGAQPRAVAGMGGPALLAVAAQQLAAAALIRLANGGPPGTVVVFALVQAVVAVPYAVVVAPLVTTAYPAVLSDSEHAAVRLERARRQVVWAGVGAAAGLAALALPLGWALSGLTSRHPSVGLVAVAIAVAAPGVLGLGVSGLVGRVLTATGAARAAAGWAVAGAVVTVATAGAASVLLPAADRVVALAGASTVGLVVAAVGLLRVTSGRERAVRRPGEAPVTQNHEADTMTQNHGVAVTRDHGADAATGLAPASAD